MITRMGTTAVWVDDGDKAYEFYAKKLGFKVTQDRKFDWGRFLMVVPPGGGTQLIVSTPAPGMAGVQVGGETPIVWETDDIHATYEDLRAKGVEFPEPPTQQFWGGFQAAFKDASGNLYKLIQPAGRRG